MYKKIIWAVLAILATIGLIMFVRYEIKVYNTLIQHSQRINIMDDFLTTTFKDQVNSYVQSKKTPSTVPAVNAPVAPKK